MIYFAANYVGEVHNLLHPRVLWNSVTRRATVAVSTEATGFEGVNALSPAESGEWKPTALPATFTLTFDTTETVNALAIHQHTLGTSGATATVQGWTGSAWEDIVAATPADDETIAFLFHARSTDRIRLSITGATIPKIAVIHCCDALELPQRVYMGVETPIDMALVTKFDTNTSTGGRWLGRSVRYSKNENDFNVKHLTEYYVRNTLMPFIKDAREYPYFLLERPHSYPTALSYRWRDVDITPTKIGTKTYMQASL